MTEHAFDGLSWTEATLQDVSFNDGTLTFQMFDLVSQAPRSYELVKVKIEGVRALELRLSPHIQGELKRPGFRGGSNTGEWSHEEVPEVFARGA